MTPLVTAAVLAAAVLHASWNAIAHGIKDQLLAFTLVGAGELAVVGVLVWFVPLPAAAAWPYLIASVLIHLLYMLLLMRSFELGDFGQVYPIARGTAPLVVTVLALVFVGERPDARQTAGVAAAGAGLMGLALWDARGSGARPRRAAVVAAVGTGLAIASYTVVDGLGVRAAGTALGYTAWLLMLQSLPIPLYALAARRGELLAGVRPFVVRGLLGGALSTVAYGLVLWAQTRAPLAPVAALRESSVVVGAAIGALVFKERFGAPRVAAATLMAAGIALMLRAG
ncbi:MULTISPECIES: DMT family transporter [Streptomyces]|uniref:EamA family transporter n=1 Tax=Streptomyces lycii TaxID=2654337 RepID=A0ABQ7F985_9ACTN|nr:MULTISPECIES: DMT family transporter [Streptomyces]KAF4405386.1 EamA family transporter [Streptomyces lycii]PGH47062.1 EamA family transporter [Streptomyces sp. Ru87]